MEANLVLDPKQEQRDISALINTILPDLNSVTGARLSLMDRGSWDQARKETNWSDEQLCINVRLIQTNELPARWVTVEASDPLLPLAALRHHALLGCLGEALPVLDYETLRKDALSYTEGALTRWSLSHSPHLAEDFPAVLATALTSSDTEVRDDAVFAAGVARLPSTLGILLAASKHETDPGISEMLQCVAASIKPYT